MPACLRSFVNPGIWEGERAVLPGFVRGGDCVALTGVEARWVVTGFEPRVDTGYACTGLIPIGEMLD
jgi:hypothetical protein